MGGGKGLSQGENQEDQPDRRGLENEPGAGTEASVPPPDCGPWPMSFDLGPGLPGISGAGKMAAVARIVTSGFLGGFMEKSASENAFSPKPRNLL
ncbi:MAG: hypothetical protein JXB25_03625 [Deltaproteobacteria bacterium]|nr:hypothetical protein [Deltaproteobacteria bacterium]